MKTKVTRVVALVATLLMSLQPIQAAVESTVTMNQAGASMTSVYADIDSDWSVTLPKAIKLDSATKSADYTVKVKGALAGSEVIDVVPDASFVLAQSGKDDVTATVTQEKTEFTEAELTAGGAEGVTATGSISATDLTAGRWDGTYNYNVEKVVQSGLYKADGTYVAWQQLLDNGTLSVSETGVLTSQYNSSNDSNASSTALSGKLIIDDSVTELGEDALAFCSNLTEITFPDSVTKIGAHAAKNSGLTNLYVPSTVETVGSGAFYNCKSLKKAVFNNKAFDSTSQIGDCTNLSYVEFGDNVTSLPNVVCRYLDNLDTIKVGSGVTTLPSSFAYGSEKLTTVILSEGLEEISMSAFNGCESLISINIPSTVTTIGNSAFSDCVNLDLTVPDTVTTILPVAFYNVKHVTYTGTATWVDGSPENWGALSRN